MKIYLTFLSLCLFICASLAQTPQLSDKAVEIRQIITQAKTEAQVVTIKVKPGARIGDRLANNKPLPNGKTITGKIVYTSEMGLNITSLLSEHTDFVYFEDIAEAKRTKKEIVRWHKFGSTMATVGLATIAIPAFFVGLCGPCGCVWN